MGTHYKPARGKSAQAEISALNAFIALLRCADAVSQSANHHLTEFKITTRQWAVLEALYHRGPLMQNALAQKLLCTPGNLTGVISKLAERDLVSVKLLKDKRCHELQVTSDGRALVEQILPAHVKAIVNAFSALNTSEQEQLRVLCKRLGLSVRRS